MDEGEAVLDSKKEKDIITCDEFCLARDNYVQCVRRCLEEYGFDDYEINEALKELLGIDY